MTKTIEFNADDAEHRYETRQDGVHIVFTCPLCPGHERRVNWITGEVTSSGVTPFRHSGFHWPARREMK